MFNETQRLHVWSPVLVGGGLLLIAWLLPLPTEVSHWIRYVGGAIGVALMLWGIVVGLLAARTHRQDMDAVFVLEDSPDARLTNNRLKGDGPLVRATRSPRLSGDRNVTDRR